MNPILTFGNLEISSLVLRCEDFIVTDNDLSKIRESIESYGIFQPIYVRPIRQREYEVLDGRKRFLVAQILKITRLPCIIYEYTNDVDAKKYYELLHNNSAISSSISKEITISKFIAELNDLIEKFCIEYTYLVDMVSRNKSNNNIINSLINKVALNLLNLRYDIQNSKYIKEDTIYANEIINCLNNIQNSIGNLGTRINSNNTCIDDVYIRIYDILNDISEIFTTTNNLNIYHNGCKLDNKCNVS